MQKTVIEWLHFLPPILKRLAIENMEHRNALKIKDNLHLALIGAFNWNKSAQGHWFWRFLYDHLRFNDNKFDPTICTTELLNSLRKDGVVVKDYYVNYVHKPIIEYL